MAAAVSRALTDPKNSRDAPTLQRKGSSTAKSSVDWSPDLREEDVVHHPSEGMGHYAGEDALENFHPHPPGDAIAEEEDEFTRNSGIGGSLTRESSSSLVEADAIFEEEETEPARPGAGSQALKAGTSGGDWADLSASGLVDVDVSEVVLEGGESDSQRSTTSAR